MAGRSQYREEVPRGRPTFKEATEAMHERNYGSGPQRARKEGVQQPVVDNGSDQELDASP